MTRESTSRAADQDFASTPDGALREVGKNSIWAFSSTAVAALGLLAETIILARYLGPAAFGTLLLLIAYPEAVQQVLDFRARDAMTRYLGGFLAEGRTRDGVAIVKLLWLVDAAVGLLTLLFVVATAWIAAELLLGDSSQGRLMAIYAFGLFFGTLDTASGSVLRVLNRFALSFAAGAGASVGRLGLILGVVLAGGGLEPLIWARAGAELLTTLLLGAVTLHAAVPILWTDRHTPIRVLGGRFREIIRFLVSSNLIGTLRTASTKLDVIVVGLIASPVTVGLYRIAVRFGTTPLMLGDALQAAVYPRFARDVVLKRRDPMRHIASRATLIIGAIMLPVALIAAIVGHDVVTLLAGSAYGAAGTAFTLCFAGASLAVLFFWAPSLILATGHASRLLAVVAAAVVTQFAGLLLLVPPLGAPGAAAALVASQLLLVTLQIAFIRRRRLLGDHTLERSTPTFAQ